MTSLGANVRKLLDSAIASRNAAREFADGQWHDRAEIIGLIAPHVPPGQAVRNARRLRQRQADIRRARGAPVIPANARPGDDQAVGAHDIARSTINNAIGVERQRTPDGRTLIRRTPSP
jgi:hypothetical protein